MKKHNYPLIIGCIILVFLLIVMIFPGLFTQTSPYSNQSLLKWDNNGELMLLTPPFPPSEFYALGSDEIGRSVLSIIIYGTRLTILLGVCIAIGRFLLALPLGIIAGFGSHTTKSIIKQSNIILSAIPALIVSIIILKQNFFVTLDKHQSFIAFILVLSLVGWPKLGNLIMARTEQIMNKPFIKGEIAIGKKPFAIAFENVLPHLVNEIIVLFFMEIARALSMIMQLGIFGVFIGNIKLVRDTTYGIISYYNLSFEPEWASMLGTARVLLRSAPWIIIFPAIAFFISVLGFNMVGEGLRISFQSKNKSGLKKLKKMLNYISNKLKSKRVAAYAIALILVIIIATSGISRYINAPAFTLDNQNYNLPSQALIGTDETIKLQNIIIEQMKDLGIQPLNQESYINPYDISTIYYAEDLKVSLNNSANEISLQIFEDYAVTQFQTGSYKGQIFNALNEDIVNVTDYSQFDHQYVLIDCSFYDPSMVNRFAKLLESNSQAKGLIKLVSNDAILESNISNQLTPFSVISIREKHKDILTSSKTTLNIELSTETNKHQGANIFGILKSDSETLSEDVILVGLGYNYLDSPEKMKFNLELMSQLAQQEQQKRSIIFAFFDGTISDQYNGAKELLKKNIYPTSNIKLFFDLKNIYDSRIDQTVYDYQQAPMTRYFAWSIGYFLEEKLVDENISFKKLKSIDVEGSPYFIESHLDNLLFWSKGISTIIIKTPIENITIDDLDTIGHHIIDTIEKNNF